MNIVKWQNVPAPGELPRGAGTTYLHPGDAPLEGVSARRAFGTLISAGRNRISLLRLGASGFIAASWRAWRSPAAQKKELEWPPNGLGRGAPRGRTPISPRALPDHGRYRPDPAGHLAGRRAVRHAGPLSRLRHGVAPVPQAAVALRGVPRRRRRDPVARPRLLGVARRHRHVPRRLDERAPHVGVPRAGDPAAGLGLAARALRGREPAPRGERRRAREPREVARLGGEQERGGDVVNVNPSFTDSTNAIAPIAPTHPRRFRRRQAPFPASRSGARSFVR